MKCSITISWRKLLSRNDATRFSLNEQQKPTSEAEEIREETYQRFRRQQQYDFSLATTSWSKAEQMRRETFQRLITDASDTSTSSQDRRLMRFSELMIGHTEISRVNDKARQTAFDGAQVARIKLFQSMQEERGKAVAKSAAFQGELYANGHNQRETEQRQLLTLFRGSFEKMIREREAAFWEAQHRRQMLLVRHSYLVRISGSSPLDEHDRKNMLPLLT